MDIGRALGRAIRDFRRAAGMSQQALADAVDMHHTAISRIESGANVPTVPVIIRLAEATGHCPGRLLQLAHRAVLDATPRPPPAPRVPSGFTRKTIAAMAAEEESRGAAWERVRAINAARAEKIAASAAGKNRRG